MKVFYVGQMFTGSTCVARAEMLQAHGCKIIAFNTMPYLNGGGRIAQALQHRLLDGPQVRQFNRDLINYAGQLSDIDVVWVDKGRWVFPSTLEKLRKRLNALIVHYTPDPAFLVHTSRHFINGLKLYDLVITTKQYEIEQYRAFGVRDVMFTWQGIDERFGRIEACAQIDTGRDGAVFMGHCEDHYVRQLSQISRSDLPLKVWGNGWPEAARKNQVLTHAVQGAGVYGDGYPLALAGGKVGIGLLSKFCPDAYTTRTFEVPGAGAMLLAEDTQEHRDLYVAGEEADFFSSTEEMTDKLAYYLSHDAKRVDMARKARDKTLRHYTWTQVLKPVLNNLMNRIQAGSFNRLSI